jgi:predicted transcriptional regulator
MTQTRTLQGASDATPEITPAVMALAHAIRRDIIRALADGHTTPKGIAEVIGKPLGVVAYHVRMLRDYGLIEVERTEPRRGALQHFYRFTDQAAVDFTVARDLADIAYRAATEATR